MSKFVLIRSIIITIVVVLPTCTNTLFSSQYQNATAQTSVATTSNFLTYINHIYGIKIRYPADWRLGEHHYTNIFAVDFISTSKNNSDTAPATITLSVETLKQNKTLNGFTIGNLAKARQLPGFQLIQSNATTLASTPAHKIIYFFSSADPTIQLPFISMNIWTIKQSKVYSISYTEAKPQYVKYLPITQKMIDSFELIK
ncbi:MAG TPA: PsbP-related protein [Nitrososphaeraceae archaeon]|nr:PsbP-related protein [Nitrososphaeraceae archaeon]